jgi:hypothetical protein
MTDLFVLFGLGLVFILVGLVLNVNNARYLLSGYNTMSEQQQKQVDIAGYIKFFKRFHYFLGISLISFGSLMLLVDATAAGIFMVLYPLLAYLVFIFKSVRYSEGPKTQSFIGAGIILAVLALVTVMLARDLQPTELITRPGYIELTGSYGEIIPFSQISAVSFVEVLPKIASRSNGLSLGEVHKGYFKTVTGEKIKLLISSSGGKYFLIQKSGGHKIFVSGSGPSFVATCDSIIRYSLNPQKIAVKP